MLKQISLPTTDEYAPFYADYIQRAQQRGDVYGALPQQIDELHSTLDRKSTRLNSSH